MKHYFFMALFLSLASLSMGQKQSNPQTAVPSDSPESEKIRNFGSSLEQYAKKKEKKSPDKQPSKKVVDDDEVIRVETDLVLHDYLVTDPKGNVITGLRKGDFVVSEDGVTQNVEIFSSSTNRSVPRSIVLIIDGGLNQLPYLQMSVESAKALVDKLGPQDKLAIVTAFGKLERDFTADKAQLKATLDFVEKQGRELRVWVGRRMKSEELEKLQTLEKFKTKEDVLKAYTFGTFGSLIAVLNEMFDEPGRQQLIVFQGDGFQVSYLKLDKEHPNPLAHSTRTYSFGGGYTDIKKLSAFGFADVKEAIESSRTSIYSIITGVQFFGLPEKQRIERAERMVDVWTKEFNWKGSNIPARRKWFVDREEKRSTAAQSAMYRVAELSGGNTAVMEKPEDAERIYSDILAVINNRYVLGYYPSDSKKGEKRRNVKVEIRGHPEYVITGRSTYILK
ncbi:MAG: VWA domain-containing protein [Pyrinomonadaceae bacterium]